MFWRTEGSLREPQRFRRAGGFVTRPRRNLSIFYFRFLPFSLRKNIIVSHPAWAGGEPWVVFLFLFIGLGPGLSLAAKERKAGARKEERESGSGHLRVKAPAEFGRGDVSKLPDYLGSPKRPT